MIKSKPYNETCFEQPREKNTNTFSASLCENLCEPLRETLHTITHISNNT